MLGQDGMGFEMHSFRNHRHFERYLLLECCQGILKFLSVGRAFGIMFLNKWLVYSHGSQVEIRPSISGVGTRKNWRLSYFECRPLATTACGFRFGGIFVPQKLFGINRKHTFGSFETLGTLKAAIVAMTRRDCGGKCEVWWVEKLGEASSCDFMAVRRDNKEKRLIGVEQRIRIRDVIEEFVGPHKHIYSPRSPSSTTALTSYDAILSAIVGLRRLKVGAPILILPTQDVKPFCKI